MSFIDNNGSEYISARITNKGRESISKGNFNVAYFQIGDSEYDYNFNQLNGNNSPAQKIFTTLDKDSLVKYPYKIYSGDTINTTFGTPIESSYKTTIKNQVGQAGFVNYNVSGSTITCDSLEYNNTSINGSKTLTITSGFTVNAGDFLTLIYKGLYGSNAMITSSSNSEVYKIVGITGMTIELDRNMPNISSIPGVSSLIKNKCSLSYECLTNDLSQQDPWTLDIVWSQKHPGLNNIDENLTGFTGNVFVSTKEFLGYTSSNGQLSNTGTTITNSFGDIIIVEPEEQHSLAIIHYSEPNTEIEPEKFYKYEDYISSDIDDISNFQIYIPFLLYERNSSSTIGAKFNMDSVDYYINSTADDTKMDKLKFRYLIDEQNVKVGKIFVDKKIIVFDDQEIVAALDYKSNRRHTLPIPRITQIASDLNYNQSNEPLISSVNETVYVTYLLQYDGSTSLSSLHCNHFMKITGTTIPSDISLKFNTDSFKFLKSQFSEFVNGYIANTFKVLIQKVTTGEQPLPNLWKSIDLTSSLPGHTVGNLINPTSLRDVRFVITNDMYENSEYYSLESVIGQLPNEPSSSPQFGDEQPFPGSIKLVRSTDIYTMRYYVNLPIGVFTTTQNPTWTTGKTPKITEIGLLNNNKELMIVGKISKPIDRTGSQVFGLKIDF